MFNVTKDVRRKQIGGKINEALNNLFTKYENNEPLVDEDFKNIKGVYLIEDERFENMSGIEQKNMQTWIKHYNKTFLSKTDKPEKSNDKSKKESIKSNAAFFICKYCKNSKPIEPGTLLYSKTFSSDNQEEDDDYSYAIHDQSLARTRNYICKNPKCETHKKPDIREAAITKKSSYQVIYVCTVCTKHWSAAI